MLAGWHEFSACGSELSTLRPLAGMIRRVLQREQGAAVVVSAAGFGSRHDMVPSIDVMLLHEVSEGDDRWSDVHVTQQTHPEKRRPPPPTASYTLILLRLRPVSGILTVSVFKIALATRLPASNHRSLQVRSFAWMQLSIYEAHTSRSCARQPKC